MDATNKTNPSNMVPGISNDLTNQLSEDINNMLSFAIHNGLPINPEVNTLVQNSSVDDLFGAYNLLLKNVAPATPKSIQYTKSLYDNSTKKTLLNKLPLVRNLILLALVFLSAFIITSLFPEVNNDSLDEGIMSNSGKSLLLNLVFLASVSGLGVVFYMLKDVSSSVKDGTLIPEDTIYYVALVVLGVIAGLIMSEILSLYNSDPNGINLFNKSVLALVGGFSSDAIFSILQGVINKIKSIFTG
ncbi:MAG TPA: hypothetical protein DCS66_09390 [Flavobacteriaceae bacterium]|nr:hypothetical protein [Flavobacteriaceae bacterium]HAT64802.1 hypothetical protein [Flavobacteriaceae bacterium]|tara:strand:- start:404 stop:1135 length:732 start_codon:yes stop_codon:yes gene_type:complete